MQARLHVGSCLLPIRISTKDVLEEKRLYSEARGVGSKILLEGAPTGICKPKSHASRTGLLTSGVCPSDTSDIGADDYDPPELCRELAAMTEGGTLEVLVQDAVQLPVVNHIGKQSPYCILSVNGERKQTRVCANGGKHPSWGERLSFNLEPGHSVTSLSIEIYHESKYGKGNVFIAGTTVRLENVLIKGWSYLHKCAIGDSGVLSVHLSFVRSQDGQQRSSSLGSMKSAADSAALRSGLQGSKLGLDAGIPERKGSMQSQPSWLTSPSNRIGMEGQPSWLSGAVPQSQPYGGHHTSQEGYTYNRPAHLEEGAPASSLSSEASSMHLPQHDSSDVLDKPGKDRPNSSPTTSFRKRFKAKWPLGLGKHSSKELIGSPQRDGLPAIPSNVPEEGAGSGQSTPKRQSGDGSSYTDAAAQPPQEHLLGEVPLWNSQANGSTHSGSNVSLDLLSNSSAPLNPQQSGGTALNTRTSGGFVLEPVEGVSNVRTPAVEAWQRHHLSEGVIPPTRQTDDTAVQSNLSSGFPGFPTSDGRVQNPGDSQNSFWRGGREVREWGQTYGNPPPFATMAKEGFSYWPTDAHPPMWNSGRPSAARPPLWDSERKMTSMQEVMHSVTTTSFPLNVPRPTELSFGTAFAGQTGLNAPPLHLTEPAVSRTQTPMADGGAPLISERSDSHRRLKSIDSARDSAGRLQLSESKISAPDRLITESSATPSNFPGTSQFGSEISHQGTESEAGASLPVSEQTGVRQNGRAANGEDDGDGVANERNGNKPSGLNMRRVEFDLALGQSPQDANTGAPDGQYAHDIASFKGVPSPFGADDTPFESESLASSPRDGGTASVGRPVLAAPEPLQPTARPSDSGGTPGNQDHAARRASRSSETGSPSPQHSLPVLDVDTWEIQAADLEICKGPDGKEVKLGKGSFGTVYKGVYEGSTDVAIKTLTYSNDEERDTALHEVAILRAQHHPNILQFLGACVGEGSIQLVTELMAGNLYTALHNKKCTWYKGGKGVAKNIASALAFLHKRRVVHLDVKSANILLTANNVAKLGDLGLSALMKGSFVNTIKGMGSFHWSAPELLMGSHPVGLASDVYSFGTVLWEICTGEAPHRGQLRNINAEGKDEAPAAIADLVHRCLDFEPKKRPTMQEIFNTLRDLDTQPSGSSSQ